MQGIRRVLGGPHDDHRRTSRLQITDFEEVVLGPVVNPQDRFVGQCPGSQQASATLTAFSIDVISARNEA
jgi:hypothetical protein